MICLEGIQRIFSVGEEKVHALRDISLQILPGEYIAVMGPSGSGKSTLLNTMGLLDRPDQGTYSMEGRDVTKLDDREQARVRQERIGFIFQFFHLVPRLTAEENIELPLVIAGVLPSERKKRVDAIVAALGLSSRARHRPDQLSGGQRQRVAIARATVTNPAVLLADEPTGNLDRTAGREVVDILEGLNAEGLTLIMVTHDPELGKRARRRIQMEDGRIVDDNIIRLP
ncbi:MAG: ABC transporter ATP-binding protein [Desulfobulbaceae bacterium]|uniref:ABC transporter ATP-binding protein n=1 Tax=Candidatus Desulfobia pelagia TaxID=2841692 RepID=A0A8J6NE24_9BACT|nr:ABC transporter ATP-binding protein [Candidatus Desulfobia pelagia]